jgi:PAS domain S-box-containing protein
MLHSRLTIEPDTSAHAGAAVFTANPGRGESASELQARLAAIVESSDDAIISKSLEGIIQTWNRGAERIFGYTAEDVIGKHISILAVPDHVDEMPKILERVRRGERVEHYQTKRRTKDGRVVTVSLTVSPVRNASGKIIAASKIARDITERERDRKALEAANNALRQSNLDLQQFAHVASHDLREPLRMMSMFAAMLERKFGGQLGKEGDECIHHIVEGAERMQNLIDDLLALRPASEHTNLLDFQPEQTL